MKKRGIFGNWLYQMINARGLTRQDVMARVGCSNSAIQKWYASDTPPHFMDLHRFNLAKLFGMTEEDLLTKWRNGLDHVPDDQIVEPAKRVKKPKK